MAHGSWLMAHGSWLMRTTMCMHVFHHCPLRHSQCDPHEPMLCTSICEGLVLLAGP